MTRKQLIAEIQTSLRQYDESGLIDYRSLNRWIRQELKRFGTNIMVVAEKFMEVKDGKATLPEDFYTLKFAVKCDKDSYYVDDNCRKEVVESNYWKQRLESTYVWDNQSNSHVQQDFKCIEEKIVHNNCQVTLRYTNPTMLKLTKGVKRDLLANECKNLKIFNCPYEINIDRETVKCNFKNGNVYIQYYAIPTDDDGDLLIPDLRNLEEYLIAYCKRRILEDVFYNDDDTNMINKLQLIKQEERELYGFAQTEVKMNALGKDWWKKIKRNNVCYTNQFERLFPNQ